MIDKAIELKKEQPHRSESIINRFLEKMYSVTVPKTTLYRHLKNAGATRLKLGIAKTKIRKRWSRDHTHDLWVGDFEEGPGGLIEKFIQTAQSQLEAEVRAGDLLTLAELNQALAAWLNVGYHQDKHSETGHTPQDRYKTDLKILRQVDMSRVIESFMQSVDRTIHASIKPWHDSNSLSSRGAIALIIGQTGLGKSSLLRLFIHELPQNRFNPIYLHLTPLSANAFLRLKPLPT